jgi:hypothetical protein
MNYDKAPTFNERYKKELTLATKYCLEKKHNEAKKVLSEILKVCIMIQKPW